MEIRADVEGEIYFCGGAKMMTLWTFGISITDCINIIEDKRRICRLKTILFWAYQAMKPSGSSTSIKVCNS